MNEPTKKLFEVALSATIPNNYTTLNQEQVYKFSEEFSNLLITRFINLIGDEILSQHYLENDCGQDTMHHFKKVVKEYFGVDK